MENGGNRGEPRKDSATQPRFFHVWRRLVDLLPRERGDGRIFERVPAQLTLRYQNLRSKEWGLAQTRDISAKGIGLLLTNPMPLNTPLELWLPVPDKGESVYSQGTVVWAKTIWYSKYRAGIKLNRPDLVGLLPILRQRLFHSL